MSGPVKRMLNTMFSEDMAKQSFFVEMLTLVVFALLAFVIIWLASYKIPITAPQDGQRVVIEQKNIFELLLSKKE
ncbi:MAG: hypothetical protein ABIJ26_06270 [Candidatus Margulisiibacteriota bacterium]|nr:hypothetical protein [Candidatus Margulisiibacteriota bacterium]